MDQLWAPWRLSYVAAPKKPTGDGDCFICEGVRGQDDRRNLVAVRTPHAVVLLNRFPYNNGHLLVAPKSHKGQLQELDPTEMLDTMETVSRMVDLLSRIMHPEGYNIGLNLGSVAGAGLPGHLHWHIVPRWAGDTNFMPVVSDTKVIAQSLESLYDLVVENAKLTEA
jgi:ATP adenylyltransferase